MNVVMIFSLFLTISQLKQTLNHQLIYTQELKQIYNSSSGLKISFLVRSQATFGVIST